MTIKNILFPAVSRGSEYMSWEMRHKKSFLAGLLLLYLLLVFIFYHGLFVDFSHKVPQGDKADLKFILSIVDFSIRSDWHDLYNFPIFYPESYSLVRTHPLFGISIFYKVFKWGGLDLAQSTNLYIILGLIIGALGCFLLAREVSGNIPISLAFSILYIVHPLNYLHFIWLNFFSRFWIPYIFLFLLRYFRTGKQLYAAGAAAFSFMEFFACIYLGTVVGVFLLPAFIVFAWLLGLIDWRRLLALGGWFFLVLVLIFIVFFPYLRFSLKYAPQSGYSGVSPAKLFGYVNWVVPLKEFGYGFFPGVLALAGFVLFFVRVQPGKRLLVFLLLFSPVPILAVMAFSPGFFMEALFLVWMVMLTVALWKGWNELEKVERLVALTFAFFVLINLRFKYLPLFRSISLLDIFFIVLPPIRGLRMISRAFFSILPFFVVLAVAGMARLPRLTAIRLRSHFWVIALVFLVAAENFHLPTELFGSKDIMSAIPYRDVEVYRDIPFRSDQVVLEIPYDFHHAVRNSQYLLNWRFHQNYLLNGKAKERPRKYWRKLISIIGEKQRNFPTDSKLHLLLREYSVGWVIVHWNFWRKMLGKSYDHDQIWERIKQLKRFGRVVSAKKGAVLIEVREFEPIAKLVRTYSAFHLRRRMLSIRLNSFQMKGTSAWLNGQQVGAPIIVGKRLFLDFRRQSLLTTGNRVEVRFSRPLRVLAVQLWPEKRPLPGNDLE
jgi:hypothetical protein